MSDPEIAGRHAFVLLDLYRAWFENLEAGHAGGYDEEGPADRDREAYGFAAEALAMSAESQVFAMPADLAPLILDRVRGHLEDWTSGIEDGTYEEPYPEGADEAVAALGAAIGGQAPLPG